MPRLVQIIAGVLGALVFGAAGAAEMLIDFEIPVVAVSQTELPGNTYNASGVTFSTVELIGTPQVGQPVSLSPFSNFLRIYRGGNAFSGDQFAGPGEGGGERDLLMHFSTPVTKVSVVSDQTVEPSQLIRLIALLNLGPNYEVLGFVEGDDAAIGLPQSLLELDLGGTSFFDVLFEVTTEQEGFDDLRFTTVEQVPEPAPLALLAAVALLFAGARRRQSR